MTLIIAALNFVAGLVLLFAGATLIADHAMPRRWAIAAFVVLDAGLIASGLIALPFALLSQIN